MIVGVALHGGEAIPERRSGGDGLGLEPELGEQLVDDVVAAAAAGAGAAALGQGLGVDGPGGDLGCGSRRRSLPRSGTPSRR